MAVNLTLRTSISPYGDTTKGSVLSQAELDSNFIGLKGEVIYTAQTSGSTVTLKKFNGNDLTFNVGSSSGVSITGGTYSAGTAVFTNNTGGTFSVTGFYTGTTDVFVTGGTYSAGTASFTNNTGGTFSVTGFSTGNTSYYIITKSELDSHITGDTLVEGASYKITGVNPSLYGGTSIFVQATSSNSISPIGVGEFYNPDYESYPIWSNLIDLSGTQITSNIFNINETITGNGGQTGQLIGLPYYNGFYVLSGTSGDWSTAISFTSNTTANIVTGITATLPSYSVGSKVIWGGKVWENLTASAGTSTDIFNLDNVNWSAVTYNDVDYVRVYDQIEYEYEFDNISYRKDSFALNEVRSNYIVQNGLSWGYSAVKCFPFGYNTDTGSTINNCVFNNCQLGNIINFNGDQILNITAGFGSHFDAIYWGRNSTWSNISLGDFCIINNILNGDNRFVFSIKADANIGMTNIVSSHRISQTISFAQIFFNGGGLIGSGNPPPLIDNVIINGSSFLQNISIDSALLFGGGSGIDNIDLINSSLYDVTLGKNAIITASIFVDSNINNINLDTNGYLENFNIFNSSVNTLQLGPNTYMKDISASGTSIIANIKLAGTDDTNTTNLSPSYITGVTLDNQSSFGIIDLGLSSTIQSIDMTAGDIIMTGINTKEGGFINNITFTGSVGDFNAIELGVGAGISDINIGANSQVNLIVVGQNSFITGVTIGSNSVFNNVNMMQSSAINDITLGDSANITYIQMGVETNFLDSLVPNNMSITDITLGEFMVISGFTATSPDDGFAIVEKGNNTLRGVLDITGLSNIDLGSVFYAGNVILTSSNSNETITGVTFSQAFPQSQLYPVTFYPESGLTVTFSGTSVATMTFPTTQIAMTTASFAADGSNFDSFTIKNNTTYNVEIDSKQYL